MFTLKCRRCRGRGYYGDDPKDECPLCEGRGHIFVEGDRAEFRDCKPCRASGFMRGNPKETCENCSGRGLVRKA